MTGIFVCGDPHGKFSHIVDAVAEFRPIAIILLGDNTPERPLHEELEPIMSLTEVFWIPGNHDTDEARFYDNQFESSLADRNIHGRVVEVGGVRIAGVGGIFRAKVWNGPHLSADSYLEALGKGNRWRGGLPLRHRSSIFKADVQLLSERSADVLVSHEAPSHHPHGSAVLTGLAMKLGVRHGFHGHVHADISYPGTVWKGVGLRGIVTTDGDQIRHGEPDESD